MKCNFKLNCKKYLNKEHTAKRWISSSKNKSALISIIPKGWSQGAGDWECSINATQKRWMAALNRIHFHSYIEKHASLLLTFYAWHSFTCGLLLKPRHVPLNPRNPSTLPPLSLFGTPLTNPCQEQKSSGPQKIGRAANDASCQRELK